MTDFILDKLTQAFLIAIATCLAACYAWELKTLAIQSIVESENTHIREKKRFLREQTHVKSENQEAEQVFVPTLSNDDVRTPDAW